MLPNSVTLESNFTFLLSKLPKLSDFHQEVTIPEMTSTPAGFATALRKISIPGPQLEQAQLTVNFLMDENWTAYLEVYEWLFGVTSPDDAQQYAAMHNKNSISRLAGIQGGLRSDAIVTVLSNAKRPILRFTFTDCFPTSLPSVVLTTKTIEDGVFTLPVALDYVSMKVEKI